MQIFAKQIIESDLQQHQPNIKPIFIDMAVADEVFKPVVIGKNGKSEPKSFKFTKKSFERAVEKGLAGRPIYITEDYSGHGVDDKGKRTFAKAIGTTTGGEIVEENGRTVLRIGATLWNKDFEEDALLLEKYKNVIGSSIEVANFQLENDQDIIDFDFTGSALLDKNAASIKNTRLYCQGSDLSMLSQLARESNVDKPKKNVQIGGDRLNKTDIATLLAQVPPELKQTVDLLLDEKEKDVLANLQFDKTKKELDTTSTLLAQKDKELTDIKVSNEKLLAELNTAKSQLEEKDKQFKLMEAIDRAQIEFDKVATIYAEANHKELKEILVRVETGDAKPDDFKRLMAMKTIPQSDGNLQPTTGGTPPVDSQGRDAVLKKMEIYLLKTKGIPQYTRKGVGI